MKTKTLLAVMVVLLVFVSVSCIASEVFLVNQRDQFRFYETNNRTA